MTYGQWDPPHVERWQPSVSGFVVTVFGVPLLVLAVLFVIVSVVALHDRRSEELRIKQELEQRIQALEQQ